MTRIHEENFVAFFESNSQAGLPANATRILCGAHFIAHQGLICKMYFWQTTDNGCRSRCRLTNSSGFSHPLTLKASFQSHPPCPIVTASDVIFHTDRVCGGRIAGDVLGYRCSGADRLQLDRLRVPSLCQCQGFRVLRLSRACELSAHCRRCDRNKLMMTPSGLSTGVCSPFFRSWTFLLPQLCSGFRSTGLSR